MSDTRRVTIHLTAQATIEFSVSQLWPMHGEYGRFGTDLASFTTEVGRRLIQDSYLCFCIAPDRITMIPSAAIKRLDFTE